jgi:hypothetical protein
MIADNRWSAQRRPWVEAYVEWALVTLANHGLFAVVAFLPVPPDVAASVVLMLTVGLAVGAVTVLDKAGHRRRRIHHDRGTLRTPGHRRAACVAP